MLTVPGVSIANSLVPRWNVPISPLLNFPISTVVANVTGPFKLICFFWLKTQYLLAKHPHPMPPSALQIYDLGVERREGGTLSPPGLSGKGFLGTFPSSTFVSHL